MIYQSSFSVSRKGLSLLLLRTKRLTVNRTAAGEIHSLEKIVHCQMFFFQFSTLCTLCSNPSHLMVSIYIKFLYRQMQPHLRSCPFITVMRARLKVPAKNSPALLFLSRGKEEKEKQQQSAAFPLPRKSRAGEFLAGIFKHTCTTVIKRQDLK